MLGYLLTNFTALFLAHPVGLRYEIYEYTAQCLEKTWIRFYKDHDSYLTCSVFYQTDVICNLLCDIQTNKDDDDDDVKEYFWSTQCLFRILNSCFLNAEFKVAMIKRHDGRLCDVTYGWWRGCTPFIAVWIRPWSNGVEDQRRDNITAWTGLSGFSVLRAVGDRGHCASLRPTHAQPDATNHVTKYQWKGLKQITRTRATFSLRLGRR